MTDAEISEASGVPVGTVGRMRRGEIKTRPVIAYRKAIEKLYFEETEKAGADSGE